MNKQELISSVADAAGLTKADAGKAGDTTKATGDAKTDAGKPVPGAPDVKMGDAAKGAADKMGDAAGKMGDAAGKMGDATKDAAGKMGDAAGKMAHRPVRSMTAAALSH